MKDTALMIIDVQNDYFTGGKMALPGAEEAAEKIRILLEQCRKLEMPIYHIQHESINEGAAFFIPGTEGQKIYPLVTPAENEDVIRKNFPNSFLHTDLQKKLQEAKINKLIITGMMTFMCVDATTRTAKDLGYECILVHDCTATPPTEFGGIKCTAEQAHAAFTCALTHICSEVRSAEEVKTMLESK